MQQPLPAPPPHRAIVTAALALAMLLASLGTSIANIALPTLAAAFSAPFAKVQMVVAAYLATLTVTVVVAGRFGDRFGLKPMLVVGLAVFAASSLLCATAPNLPALIAARGCQGVGAAFLMTLAMALMRQTASEARVGRAMGLLGTVSALGTALGPVLGGVLIPLAGWRSVFWAQTPLASLALVLAVVALPGGREARAPAPVGLRRVLTRAIVPNLTTNLLVAAVMMATLVVGPFYLSFGLRLQPTEVGLVMAVGPAIAIVSGIPSGRLVDAWGGGRGVVVGLTLMAVGASLLALLPNRIGISGYLLAIVVLTPGYQLFQAANTTETLAGAAHDRRGTIAGLLGLSRNLGLIAGASAMGTVFAFGVGGDDFAAATPKAISAGMTLTFALASAMVVAAIAVGLAGHARRAL